MQRVRDAPSPSVSSPTMALPQGSHVRTISDDTQEPRFLRACRGQPTDATPIWMMRQAGRTIPAYRELRERYGFLDVVGDPALIAEVTLLPMREAGFDAAVMFADIMLPLAALGIEFEIAESIGPIVHDPIRDRARIDRLERIPIEEVVPAVLAAIPLIRGELAERAPLIGFSGAPFTLASYLIEGRPTRDFTKTKRLMFAEPDAWHALMDRLTDLVVEYLAAQARAGVQAIQLFDSWIGALGPHDLRTFVLPYTAAIFERCRSLGLPQIAFGTNTATLLELIAETGPDVVSVDHRIPLDQAWARIGSCGIQGNLEPAVLLGPAELIVDRVRDVLRRAGGRPGHIFNLGHGVLPETPLDAIRLVVDTVHETEVR